VFRPKAFYSEQRIELIPAKAEAIDRGKKIRLSAGAELQYGHLVLAVGARNRELRSPHEEGCIHYIRTLAETARLKERLLSARHVTVVGAGFIGLEFASAARLKGFIVDVIELGQRLMERAVTPEISQFFLRRHERSGVNFHFGTEVAGIERGGGDGRYTIALAQGKKIETDLVVAGIGVNPNTELAASAGLVVNGGILVDQNLSTSDANISAIGDCVVFPTPYATKPVRIESVQNATDQACCLAARLIGKGAPYRSLPWFWSDQGSDKLQIVGLTHDVDRTAASRRRGRGGNAAAVDRV
jgi:3-phenylpropionate/trans-cinnamate dioxygenase ferredoxin reductase subunit